MHYKIYFYSEPGDNFSNALQLSQFTVFFLKYFHFIEQKVSFANVLIGFEVKLTYLVLPLHYCISKNKFVRQD